MVEEIVAKLVFSLAFVMLMVKTTMSKNLDGLASCKISCAHISLECSRVVLSTNLERSVYREVECFRIWSLSVHFQYPRVL
jgi:hypothetical protein